MPTRANDEENPDQGFEIFLLTHRLHHRDVYQVENEQTNWPTTWLCWAQNKVSLGGGNDIFFYFCTGIKILSTNFDKGSEKIVAF